MCKALRMLSNSQWVQYKCWPLFIIIIIITTKAMLSTYIKILQPSCISLYLLYLKTSLQPILFVSLIDTTTFPSAMRTVGNSVLTQSSDSVGVYQRDCETTESQKKQSYLLGGILPKSSDNIFFPPLNLPSVIMTPNNCYSSVANAGWLLQTVLSNWHSNKCPLQNVKWDFWREKKNAFFLLPHPTFMQIKKTLHGCPLFQQFRHLQ